MAKMLNPRATAAHIIFSVAHEGTNLNDALARHLEHSEQTTHAFIKALCFGCLRFYPRLLFFLSHLIDKPVKNKEKIIECLLLAGLYEIYYMQTPAHACVSETVDAALDLKKKWAKGLTNAVLRGAQREQTQLELAAEKSEGAKSAHPKWLLKLIKKHWPDKHEQIIQANNQAGPLSLRINLQKTTRDNYLQRLSDKSITATVCDFSAAGIQCAQAVDVTELPGFSRGEVSVQDQAAQLAAVLLDPQPGERILDACAAPGGKTAHLLEHCPQIELLALDKVESRVARIHDNLDRLGLNATILTGDVLQSGKPGGSWWDGQAFDRILLDAPCSATGVIRRHPDIKLLRRAEDIGQLVETQAQMLSSLWPLLKTGGMLLYSTCSILAEENDQQIQQFVQNTATAESRPIDACWGHTGQYGRQILPGESDMDGFYYASIQKL